MHWPNGSSSLRHPLCWCQFSDRKANNTSLSRIGFLWCQLQWFYNQSSITAIIVTVSPHQLTGGAAVNTEIVAKMKVGVGNNLLQHLQWDGLVTPTQLITSLVRSPWQEAKPVYIVGLAYILQRPQQPQWRPIQIFTLQDKTKLCKHWNISFHEANLCKNHKATIIKL